MESEAGQEGQAWNAQSCVRLGSKSAWSVAPRERLDAGDGQVWMPLVGLGLSYQQASATQRRTQPEPACHMALQQGYRLFDTAARYGTEEALGAALQARPGLREQVFITSKLWAADYGRAPQRYREQCGQLGVEGMDCYLIHWPEPWMGSSLSNREARAETWRQLELLWEQERVRAIGVSNFLPHHLAQLEEDASVLPHLNQIEFNPLQQSPDIVAACRDMGIVVQGYCPLGKGQALAHPLVQKIAAQYQRSPAQVLLRWSLQKEVAVIPKASSAAHLEANRALFDFHLSPEDMAALAPLHCNLRCTWDPSSVA